MHRVESFEADTVVDLHLKIDTWLKHHTSYEVVQIVHIPKSECDTDPTVGNYQVLVVYNN